MPARTTLTAVSTSAAMLLAAALAPHAASGQTNTSTGGQRLPDLDQQTPDALTIASSGGRQPHFALGFQSAVRNIGAGPLVIAGSRASTDSPTMRAHQLIARADGGQDSVASPARLRYAISPTHQHWHLLGFDRYLLRRAGARGAVVRDQKTGFCLGDRYRVQSMAVPAAPPVPYYTGGCGLREPRRLTVQEGISPGYGDNYLPYLEGQSLPLTGLAAGRYVLVHRANADHAVRESNYGNDAASLLLDLRWQRGRPSVRVLASCPDSGQCDQPAARVAASGAISTTAVWNLRAPVALCSFGAITRPGNRRQQRRG
jgi:hypothetical protein